MSLFAIRSFPQYVLRTPSFLVSDYLDLLDNYNLEKAVAYLGEPFFNEAIRLASPDLLELFNQLKNSPETLSQEKKEGLEITLLKYISRISSRCTPFGLFAGCTVGKFSSETNVVVKSHHQFKRFTQFDMHFWIGFLQKNEKQKEYIHSLKYFPNNSIYSFGDFFRYVEYKYREGKREHIISAIRKSLVLEQLIGQLQKGCTVHEMIEMIVSDESEKEEALEFIYQLIDFQFLVSELEAGVTGDDEVERVLNIIEKIPDSEEKQILLKDFRNEFKSIDQSLFDTETYYQNIKKGIEKLAFEYEPKYLFQTDLTITTSVNELNSQVYQKIIEALTFLNGIQKHYKSQNLIDFMNVFSQRYETREMPLATVLDTEIGIGYLQYNKNNDSHSILDRFPFQSGSEKNEKEIWTEIDFVLERKLQDAINDNQNEIILSEKDFSNFDSNFDYTPPTFSVITEITEQEGKEIIAINLSGNTSGSKLLGRFCNGNEEIHHLTREIIDKETEYHKNKIVAEIVHIPESRTGNVIRRPTLRKYEIPYLANSSVSKDYQIDINDLTVSIDRNTIILKSKKHNKEVIPFLSNAHNYSVNSLPIYHFLCDLQFQDTKPIYGFKWGVLEQHYQFFPRVKYKEIILSKAKWIVSDSEIKRIVKDKSQITTVFGNWKKNKNIPRFVNWVDYDNTLLLDLDQEICIKMLLNSVKKFTKIILEEFLFTENSVVKNEKGENFTNQFVMSFYKKASV
ncbi:lantibiotic dehydratase family protein [Flavobacterium sp.]|uniref:lantibiotic dehydratase family protein n=1 Tax=Flavobacterium sp. TaxID=239 RepID=UPI003D6A8EAC